MAGVRHVVPDARHRLDPAAGHFPARNLGEEREDRGPRHFARWRGLFQLRVRADLYRLRRIAHRSVARRAALDGGCARDAADPAQFHPRAYAVVDSGAVLWRAAVGDPVDRERRDHRAHFALHREHHPAVLSAHERPPVPPDAAPGPRLLHAGGVAVRPEFEKDDVRHGAERVHRDAGERLRAPRCGNLLEAGEQCRRNPLGGIRPRRLADSRLHRRRRHDAASPRAPPRSSGSFSLSMRC